MSIITEEYLDRNIQQLKEVLRNEIPAFAQLGHKFVKKEITSAEFKAASGGMGVYAQRSGSEFMIRLRALGGILDYEKLNFLYHLANKYCLDSIHLTTRQMIQLHHLSVDDMIEIMEESIDHDMITRGSGGNFPRNATLSPLSGVEKEEAFDVTSYAILVNKYFLSQINSYQLPRKFKVAFSNHGQDSAKASIADLGFLAVRKEEKEYFQVYLGGSMGQHGATSVVYDELISPQDILYHVEAILSLFTKEGDYQNKAKARMRFIVQRMGREAFLDCYKKHLDIIMKTKDLSFKLNKGSDYPLETQGEITSPSIPEAIQQKQPNFYSVDIHPQAGCLSTKALGDILQFIQTIKAVQVRLTMEGSMMIRNLTKAQAKELLELTKEVRKTTRLGKSISCVGAAICQIGIQTSQTLLANILDFFNEKGLLEDILPTLAISGCTNSCARHQVSEIGFQGKIKRINDVVIDAYSLQVGGLVGGRETKLATEFGDLAATQIPEFLYELAVRLKETKKEFCDYRIEMEDEFKSLVAEYRI